MTIQIIKDSIDDFFSDTTRSPESTKEGLEEIRDEIEMKIECLKCDLKQKKEQP